MVRGALTAMTCAVPQGRQRIADRAASRSLLREVLMRALVVDDSRAMRLILSRALKEGGCEVVEAGNGREALSALAEGPLPDVALVDWNMPVMNGLDLVEAVRKDPAYDDMPLVMVTTESESSQVLRALEAGAQEYIFKPFTTESVLGKLAMLGFPVGS